MPDLLPKYLLDRLRTESIPSTVSGSLPVLFFGDPFSALIATIGINPSRQEYLTKNGNELVGMHRRFETLNSLAATSRALLDDFQGNRAIQKMRCYFDPNRPVYAWFKGLSRVMEGMGVSFYDRSAVHLDLVQEATDPVWSQLVKADPEQAEKVLRRDLPFLQRQFQEFQFKIIVCTSARVYQEVNQLFHVHIVKSGRLARLKWSVGTIKLSRGPIGIAEWNIPLARATGLDVDGQRNLGQLLISELKLHGINLP